jgi:hypothetical protein
MFASARRLAAAGVLLAAPAAAGRLHLPAPPETVRWLSPAAADAVAAGGSLRLAWEPGPRFAELGAVEEWELFVSYDRGETWSVRLTPHLDAGIRRYAVRLPEIAADEIRLLMRIGDERVEYEVELPFALRVAAGGRKLDAMRPAAMLAAAPGESARAGAAGVALWSEGSRHGRDARWIASPGAASRLTPARLGGVVALPPLAPPERAPVPHAAPERATLGVSTSAASAAPLHPSPRRARLAPLAQTCRRNE